MAKYYYIFLFSFFSFSIQSQEIINLTDYHNPNYRPMQNKVISIEDKFYQIFVNFDLQTEVWTIEDETFKRIFETNLDICGKAINYIEYQDSLIIYLTNENMYLYNFIDLSSTVVSLPDDILKYTFFPGNIDINDGIITIDKYKYDFALEKFVPYFTGKTAFRSNSLYYIYEQDGDKFKITKRKFDDTIYTKVNEISTFQFKKAIDKALFLQDTSGNIYTIDKNDNIKTNSLNLEKIETITTGENNNLLVVSKRNNRSLIYTFDVANLSLVDSFSFSNDLKILKSYIYDNKLFLTTHNSIYYYSFTDKSINLIDEKIKITNFIDNLAFNIELKRMNIVNLKTYKVTKLNINNVTSSYRGKDIYKFLNKYYISYNDAYSGIGFYKYDNTNNFLTKTDFFPKNNNGLGYRLCKRDKTIFCQNNNKSNEIQILDESESSNLDILKFSLKKKQLQFFNDNKFYYVYKNENCSTSDSSCIDILRYNPKTNKEKVLIKEFKYPLNKLYQLKYRFIGKYMILKSPKYQDIIVYDQELDKRLQLNSIEKQLFHNLRFSTKDYFYSLLQDGLYKISITSPSNYKIISDHDWQNTYVIDDNSLLFSYKDTIFYYDGLKIQNKFYGDSSLYFWSSTNKKHILGVLEKNNKRDYFLFDRKLNKTKFFNIPQYNISRYINISLTNDRLIIVAKTREDHKIYKIFSFKLETDEVYFNTLKSFRSILSIGDNEVHFYSGKNIIVTDYNLNVIDSVQVNNYFLEYSLSKKTDYPNVFYNSAKILIYDRKKREFKEYINCEDNLHLNGVVLKDNKVYFTAENDSRGNQFYTIDLSYLTNTESPNKISRSNLINIFPNPSNDYINLNIPLTKYKIINSDGKIVSHSNKTTERIDISSFSNGIYFLIGNSLEGPKNGKFIKLK